MNNTNRPLILFDIDHTLYDTNKFRSLYPKMFAETMGTSLRRLGHTQTGYLGTLEKSTDFLPDKYLSYISKTHSFPLHKLKQIFYNPQLYKKSLYPDTIPALKKLLSSHMLGVFSEGHRDFQMTKLQLSGLIQYFDARFIFIHRRKINPKILSTVPVGSTIVDDRLDVIDELASYPHLNPIWINRAGSGSSFTHRAISSLSDLL